MFQIRTILFVFKDSQDEVEVKETVVSKRRRKKTLADVQLEVGPMQFSSFFFSQTGIINFLSCVVQKLNLL